MTKTGKKMGILNVLDLHGSFELAVFDNALKAIENLSPQERERPYAFMIKISKSAVGGAAYQLSFLSMMSLQNARDASFRPHAGVFLSENPLKAYAAQLGAIAHTKSNEFDELVGDEDASVKILCVGKIENVHTRTTKSGKQMANLTVLDLAGSFEMSAFGDICDAVTALTDAQLERPMAFWARLSKNTSPYGGKYQIYLDEILSLDAAREIENYAPDKIRGSRFGSERRNDGGNGFGGERGGGYGSGNFAERRGGFAAEDPALKARKEREAQRKNAQDFEFELSLGELSREKIYKIYHLAFCDTALKNTKRLILRIRNGSEVLVYPTEYIVSDNFTEKVREIIAA